MKKKELLQRILSAGKILMIAPGDSGERHMCNALRRSGIREHLCEKIWQELFSIEWEPLAATTATSRLYRMGYPFNPDQKETRLLMVAWLHEMVRTNAVKDLVPSLYSHYRERTPIRTPARPKTRPKAKRTRPTK